MEPKPKETESVKHRICYIPEECQLDLWAKVIIAKCIMHDEPVMGTYDGYGEPAPYEIVVKGMEPDETVECINDFKVIFDPEEVVGNFVCSSKVILTIPFAGYFWIKTNLGYKTLTMSWKYTVTIPVSDFIKLDGTPLTSEEIKENVNQSKAVVKDYTICYINILPKSNSEQKIEIIICATVVEKLSEFKDVIVHGYVEKLNK